MKTVRLTPEEIAMIIACVEFVKYGNIGFEAVHIEGIDDIEDLDSADEVSENLLTKLK